VGPTGVAGGGRRGHEVGSGSCVTGSTGAGGTLRGGARTVARRAQSLRLGFDWDGYGSSSVSLVPRTALREGERYRLEVRRGAGAWQTFPEGADEPYEWTAGPVDHDRPSWTASLAEDPDYPPTPRLTITVGDRSPVSLILDVTDGTGTTHRELTAPEWEADGCAGFDAGGPPPLGIRAYPVDAAGLRGPMQTFSIPEHVDYVRVCRLPEP